jgi:hypothetical protein
MKVSNLRDVHKESYKETIGSVTLRRTGIYATVTVKTGFLFWRKIEDREVCRKDVYWFFTDTGEWCPGSQVETLYRSYTSRSKS